jgi:hypothetical protein
MKTNARPDPDTADPPAPASQALGLHYQPSLMPYISGKKKKFFLKCFLK